MKNLTRIIVTLSLCAALASACSEKGSDDNNANNGKTSATLLYDDVIWMATSNGGEQSQLITTGKPNNSFSAVITEGAEFCSFKLLSKSDSMSGPLGKSVYIYLDANNSSADRTASIRVEFSDNTPDAMLRITQRAYSPSAKYDRHAWAELPGYVDNGDYVYKTYYTTLASDPATVRNYSICYDTKRRISHWVAYPVHTCYTTPSVSRGNNWAYDPNEYEPAIAQSLQQHIVETYGSGHQRGHMLPSASRYSTVKTNDQTFYATNMMPQNGDFNGGAWAQLESAVRSNGGTGARDTLYVVTGTWFGDNYTIEDKAGRKIAVPSHAYKVLLKARKRIPEGKSIADLEASELQAIGFWFPNPSPRASAPTTVMQAACTVADIEARTGFDYFRMLRPEVAAEVKKQCNPASWSGL